MDFASDSAVTGRRFRALAIVDDYSRERPSIAVDASLGGARVVGVLERLEETRGLLVVITVDNGPEFAGKPMDCWQPAKVGQCETREISGRTEV